MRWLRRLHVSVRRQWTIAQIMALAAAVAVYLSYWRLFGFAGGSLLFLGVVAFLVLAPRWQVRSKARAGAEVPPNGSEAA